jgi:hypothetical protein
MGRGMAERLTVLRNDLGAVTAFVPNRGPVQDESGALDLIDRAAMDAVEGRASRAEIESSTSLVYPEVADETPELASEATHLLISN